MGGVMGGQVGGVVWFRKENPVEPRRKGAHGAWAAGWRRRGAATPGRSERLRQLPVARGLLPPAHCTPPAAGRGG